MDNQEVWDLLIQKIKSYPGVNPSQIDAFFSRIQVQACSLGYVLFSASNGFMKDWVERHHMDDIKRALQEIYDTEFMVEIAIDPTVNEAEDTGITSAPAPIQPPTMVTQVSEVTPVQPLVSTEQVVVSEAQPVAVKHENQPVGDNASSLLTFKSFVIGDSNRMAYSMAIEVADRPGSTSLNPLFIYGRSGVGKTHLMCAIKNYINEQYPDLKVIYIDSMELVNRYSEAAREESVDKASFKNFEKFFKEADVLLIDDIQRLQKAPGTLNALFTIFNSQINQGKQFVFSADRAPKNIDLDERYVSRFNSGATIDIQPPDDETKRNIIKNFIQQYQQDEGFDFDLSDDVLDYIVEHSGSNIRELKSAITNVIFAIKMNADQGLTTQDVKNLLVNHFINEGGNRFTIEAIQAAVEDFYHVKHSDLVGKKRNRTIAHPRQVAIYLSRELVNTTFKDIGEAFNRDHSTIMHSYELINKGYKEDRNLREEIEAIREKLRMQEY